MSPSAPSTPRFWRDPALPFIEARSVDDGRRIGYAKHTHETFSIGAVLGGRSTYLNGATREAVGAGAVVLVNPAQVHACNPHGDDVWRYRMLYVDTGWLTGLQHALGFDANHDFRACSVTLSTQADLYGALNRFYRLLVAPDADALRKQSAAVAFFTALQRRIDPAPAIRQPEAQAKLARAADYIDAHRTQALTLDDICAAAGLSPSYLIRAFKARYGMTPHAYLVDRRIQYGRTQLKLGRPIADVALDAGFADQAHFQRAFRKVVAATPGQYRG
ncbi:AraC family transcriptional regulator [Burkholderia alba]|uniref:AraC family transcriptional regulator n=1 Tax=Burkholderia alba TaxID=2683677 RepID=UPI002B05FFE1|nr:AraC family transcriptional regulator [Burkholderia alba]